MARIFDGKERRARKQGLSHSFPRHLTLQYRSYYYTKGWHSRIIPSLLFNQPFRHNNPQRNPFPSTETVAYYANAGQYKITQPVLERLQGYRWLYYDKDGLVNFGSSTAARLPGGEEFKPVGGGYFYSSYQQATSVLVARMVGMFFENSFNLQLGDLFSTCNAGDIRIHYEIVDPTEISVIGKQIDNQGGIGLYKAANNYEIGIVVGSLLTAEELFNKDLGDTYFWLWVGRIFVSTVVTGLYLLLIEENLDKVKFAEYVVGIIVGCHLIVRFINLALLADFVYQNPLVACLVAAVLGCGIFFSSRSGTETPSKDKNM
eukprot:TRINITY_DN413_c0_g2_i10.p1 TRINITY_DN413_c0_g2~~TRINITY_DN413_c0_g2_i10.p1  ORF type:complete len:317 (+),score=48.35 TRINITY_DN413_c0_g2_i10:398-1348(+)